MIILNSQSEILVNTKYKKIKKFKFYKNDNNFIPSRDYIYVFGSNLAGLHRRDFGIIACTYFNAEIGVIFGFCNNSYIIPLYDRFIRKLSINEIKKYTDQFAEFTNTQVNRKFWITDLFISLNRGDKMAVASLFKYCNKDNCYFPISWKPYLK